MNSAVLEMPQPAPTSRRGRAVERTFPESARRYDRLRREIFRASSTRIAEWDGDGDKARPADAPIATAIDEIELQARWFSGEFGRRFATPAGEPVEVVQFGHWNRSAGPDFTEAVVRVGERLLRGAIEIDLDARDWEHHGHGVNPAYDDVVLHLFVHQPQREIFFTRDSSHREVAQAPLDLERFGDTRAVAGFVPEARLGRCAAPLETMSDEHIAGLIEAAAQFRLQRKARRLRAISAVLGHEAMLWLAAAEALGFRHNRVPMAVLAQRLPIAALRERGRWSAAEREALLFGAAGFLDGDAALAGSTARDHLRKLRACWRTLRADFQLGPERALQWSFCGSRPLNHPQRRLAALAELANRWPDFIAALPSADPGEPEPKDWVQRLHALLSGLGHPFWSRHYTLNAAPAEKPMALIGRDRVHDLIGNVVIPSLLHVRPQLWRAFTRMPAGLDNQSLRRARLRLFGRNETAARASSRRFFQQQALLQIFRDFCLEDGSDCADCPFPEQLAQWRDSVNREQ